MSISFQGYPQSRPVVNGLASSSSQTQRSSFSETVSYTAEEKMWNWSFVFHRVTALSSAFSVRDDLYLKNIKIFLILWCWHMNIMVTMVVLLTMTMMMVTSASCNRLEMYWLQESVLPQPEIQSKIRIRLWTLVCPIYRMTSNLPYTLALCPE